MKRYKIISHLASGGMADVYLARTQGMGGFERLFAIKRIRRSLSANPAMARMIVDEARIAATLQHSNICQVIDVDSEDGCVFLVMEYLHGRDVRQIQKRLAQLEKVVPLEHALNIAMAVCSGLQYAHAKTDDTGKPYNIIHRDVSPHNVFVTFDGAVKLIDFGIAKDASKRITLTGLVKGKPGFMSPEQCAGESLDRRSDIHAIGILLYEMATGSSPWDARDAEEYFNMVVSSPPMPPSVRVDDFPHELERIIMKTLAKDRNERYQQAIDLQLDLQRFVKEERFSVTPFTLAEFMHDVFKDEAESWEMAEKAGKSLADHVVETITTGAAEAQARAELLGFPDLDPSGALVAGEGDDDGPTAVEDWHNDEADTRVLEPPRTAPSPPPPPIAPAPAPPARSSPSTTAAVAFEESLIIPTLPSYRRAIAVVAAIVLVVGVAAGLRSVAAHSPMEGTSTAADVQPPEEASPIAAPPPDTPGATPNSLAPDDSRSPPLESPVPPLAAKTVTLPPALPAPQPAPVQWKKPPPASAPPAIDDLDSPLPR